MFNEKMMNKKILFLCLFSLFLFTGCTSKVTCTMNSSETGRKVSTTLKITFKGDKVHTLDENSVFTFNKDYLSTIDVVYDAMNEGYKKYDEDPGIKINTSKEKDTITVKIKIIPEKQKTTSDNIIDVQLSKPDLIKELETEGYTCK